MAEQFLFPEMELLAQDEQNAKKVALRDPAFAENKVLPLHRWVPWIAGYSASFVDDVLATYAPPKSKKQASKLLLDPFAGVGTTLVQGMLHGWQTVGFEINPYAALAAAVKVYSPSIDIARLGDSIQRIEDFLRTPPSKRNPVRNSSPKGFRSRIPFFSKGIQEEVLYTLDFIEDKVPPDIQDLFRVSLGAVMVSFSNYSYEPSLSTRPGAGKPLIENADVVGTIVNKLRQMANDIAWVQERNNCGPIVSSQHRIVRADFMASADKSLPKSSVDLMITSPPYMNNYHYVRNTRPQLFWLSFVETSSQLKKLEQSNFGKYWQTVRTSDRIKALFTNESLRQLIEKLHSIRIEKGAYGGPGWVNYVTSYFNDAQRFFVTLRNSLKRGGIGVIVVGNSIIQGIEFRVDQFFAEMAEGVGLKVEEVRSIRDKRVGASITQSAVRRGKPNKANLYEAAVIVRK